MFGSHQFFRAPYAQFILSLINKQTVFWANNQIMHIIQCARFDHDRCEITCGPHCGLPDPADFLDTFVARDNFLADFLFFNWFQCTSGQCDAFALYK